MLHTVRNSSSRNEVEKNFSCKITKANNNPRFDVWRGIALRSIEARDLQNGGKRNQRS